MKVTTSVSNVLHEKCSTFLLRSGGRPLYKVLSSTYGDFSKVKVRLKKSISSHPLTTVINTAFKENRDMFRERAIFAQSRISDVIIPNDKALYYIFPIDGYLFTYNPVIRDAEQQYDEILTHFSDYYDNITDACDTASDMMTYTYVTDDIGMGMRDGAEIIIYGISHYYCVSATLVYGDLF